MLADEFHQQYYQYEQAVEADVVLVDSLESGGVGKQAVDECAGKNECQRQDPADDTSEQEAQYLDRHHLLVPLDPGERQQRKGYQVTADDQLLQAYTMYPRLQEKQGEVSCSSAVVDLVVSTGPPASIQNWTN